jgi:NhaA family Na+:H+ antiporter
MTPHETGDGNESLNLPWSRSGRRVPRLIVRPLQQFLRTEASSGILLLAAAVGALIWANVAAGSYDRAWHTELTVGVGRWDISQDLRHWVNEAAMAVFFFVVGLEIKREFVSGELREPRVAALPAIAAAGGMVLPALVYLAINGGGAGSRGWGIPMATDIAFAVGVLALVGRGLPSSIRLFLLTLAIVDDIGAILVIAIFYSGSVAPAALATAAGLLALMVLLRRIQVRSGPLYLLLGAGVWLAVFESGVHATLAGVALAFVTPAVAAQRPRAVSHEAHRIADETTDDPNPPDADASQWLHLAGLSREAVSPLARLEHALHPWTSFLIVPAFALANAGVRLSAAGLEKASALKVAVGVLAGLVVGKTVGISLGAYLGDRSRLARLPRGTSMSSVVGAGSLGGIGFTVSLFIANLAFEDATLLDAAKLGILVGSLVSAVLGSAILVRSRSRPGTTAPADAGP